MAEGERIPSKKFLYVKINTRIILKAFLKYYLKDRFSLLKSSMQFLFNKKEPLLVLTMAKVGSLSVFTSIQKTTSRIAFHIHSLDLEEAEKSRQLCLDAGIYPGSRSPLRLIKSKILEKEKTCKIITLIRNPVERNISAFFDAFELYVGCSPEKFTGSIESLVEIYHKELPHFYPIEWFDKQFYEGTGINIFQYNFDVKNNHQEISHKNFQVLLLKSELKDQEKEQLIMTFINESNFELFNVNQTNLSKGSELYSRFKNFIRFDKSYLEALLENQYFNHFFSAEEKEKTYKRWSK